MISPKGHSEADQPAEIRCIRTNCAKRSRHRIFAADRGQLRRQFIGWPSAPRGSPTTCRRWRLQAVSPRTRSAEAQFRWAIYALLPLLPPARAARRATDDHSGAVRFGEWHVQARDGKDDPDAVEEEGRENAAVNSGHDHRSGDHGFIRPSKWSYSAPGHAYPEARRELLVNPWA